MELLPWDCWGVIIAKQLDDPDDLAALDNVASLSAGDVPDFETLRNIYETDSRFHVNETLLSYINGNMVHVGIA